MKQEIKYLIEKYQSIIAQAGDDEKNKLIEMVLTDIINDLQLIIDCN